MLTTAAFVASMALSPTGMGHETIVLAAAQTTVKTDLARLVAGMPLKNIPPPYQPVTLNLKSNGTTIFNLNDDQFRYDSPRTATTPRNDDYTAMRRVCAFFTGKQFPTLTTLVIPGTVNLDRLYIQPGSKNDNLSLFPASVRGTDIFIKDAANFQILGSNAKFVVKGDFFRPADYYLGPSRDGTAGMWKSGTRQITPLLFVNCSNFRVAGIEMDGNVDKMTKEFTPTVRVAEGGSAGIKTSGCINFTFENLYLHHFGTDGIKIGSGLVDRVYDTAGHLLREVIDQNGLVRNIISSNNGRQGITIGQAAFMRIQNSWLTLNGYTEGNYRNHAPAAGIDIEPGYGSNDNVTYMVRIMDGTRQVSRTPITTKLDADVVRHTRSITTENCVFWKNFGLQFMATPGTVTDATGRNVYTSNITLRNSNLIEEVRDQTLGVTSCVSDGTVFTNNTFDASGDIHLGGINSRFASNSVVTRGSGVRCIWPNSSVSIVNNSITRYTPMQPMESIPVVSQNCVTFSGNVIRLPIYSPVWFVNTLGVNTLSPIIQLSNCKDVSNNTWTMVKSNPKDVPRIILKNSTSSLGDILKTNVFPPGCQIDNTKG